MWWQPTTVVAVKIYYTMKKNTAVGGFEKKLRVEYGNVLLIYGENRKILKNLEVKLFELM
jgi:hypothetical protein